MKLLVKREWTLNLWFAAKPQHLRLGNRSGCCGLQHRFTNASSYGSASAGCARRQRDRRVKGSRRTAFKREAHLDNGCASSTMAPFGCFDAKTAAGHSDLKVRSLETGGPEDIVKNVVLPYEAKKDSRSTATP